MTNDINSIMESIRVNGPKPLNHALNCCCVECVPHEPEAKTNPVLVLQAMPIKQERSRTITPIFDFEGE